ncbi:MAG: hypothetical protein ACK5LN_09590 [Propioniciclava sp.]
MREPSPRAITTTVLHSTAVILGDAQLPGRNIVIVNFKLSVNNMGLQPRRSA